MINKKICKSCNVEKKLKYFFRSKEGYYFTYCKSCDSLRKREWDKRNPQKYNLQNKIKQEKLKIARRDLIEKINKIKSKGCSNCGFNKFVECIQFHHLDPLIKEESICEMISAAKKEKEIMEEINKCILLCANCHMELHGTLRETIC